MPYRVEISPRAGRDLKRLPPSTLRPLERAIYALCDEPRPRGVRKLVGAEDEYRLRVGDFRIIYTVLDRDGIVVIERALRRTETTYRRGR